MAIAALQPDVQVKLDYETWLSEVRAVLARMNMEFDIWQESWEFDFRKEYERGWAPREAALHAHDLWWRELLAKSWT